MTIIIIVIAILVSVFVIRPALVDNAKKKGGSGGYGNK